MKIKLVLAVLAFLAAGSIPLLAPTAQDVVDDTQLAERFAQLSQNGNSNCSRDFMESIAAMPATMRLMGSCCGPMSEHRYREQVMGIREYAAIELVPPDPYDIPAGIAHEAMDWFSVELTAAEADAYDYAMRHSKEGGPCCCMCWRWQVYGGLAKYLIRDLGFTGEQIANVWDLSDGCGGDEHAHT